MDAALRALMTGLVDYAGLFPPAKLDMGPAVRNHLNYREGADRWMLGRFVCPVGRLGELDSALSGHAGDPLELSAIVRGDAVADDLAELRAFVAMSPVSADAFEIRLPDSVVASPDSATIAGVLDEVADRAAGEGFGSAPLYLEAGWPDPDDLRRLLGGIRLVRDAGRDANLKIRTGGLEPAAIPSSAVLARVILACRDAEVPFKATAGLHHPVRRHDAGLGAAMHGFLNVFGGAILASVHGLGESELTEILDDEDPTAFRAGDGVFAWRGHEADAAAVVRGRRDVAVSFGSCSFDEPRDDLRAIGLMSTPS